MDEILKKLESIENKIGNFDSRLGKVEALSIATSQRVLASKEQTTTQTIAQQPITTEPTNLPMQIISPKLTEMGLPIMVAPIKSTLPPPPAYRSSNQPAQGAPSPQADLGGQKISVQKDLYTKVGSGFEAYFGQWILGIVGLISVILGVSFFLKYAFDNNLIPVTARVLLGLSGGVFFVILGEYIRKTQKKYSYILTSTGLGLLYLSTYAAYGFYNLIGPTTSFMFMTAVTIFGAILAILNDSMTLASLTATMGFFVPYLFGLQAAGDLGYFVYTLSLNIGILAISFFKKWRQLTFIGFIGTILHYSSWYGMYYDKGKLAIAIYALVVFYLIYLATNIANTFIKGEKSDRDDLIMLTLAPAWFFTNLYLLLQPGANTTLAFVAVGMSALYIVLAYVYKTLKTSDQNFSLFLGSIAAIFLTIAIPLKFDKEAITIGWAVEAVVIAILGLITGNDGMKRASIGIFAISLVRFFLWSGPVDLTIWSPILNWRFFTYLILIFTGTIIAYLFGHLMARLPAPAVADNGGQGEEYRSDAKTLAVLWTIVNALIFFSVTGEIMTYFDKQTFDLTNSITEQMKTLPPPNPLDQTTAIYGNAYNNYGQRDSLFHENTQRATIENKRNAGVSIFWTLYAIALLSIGIALKNSFVRKSALVLIGITIIKVFTYDLSWVQAPYNMILFGVFGIILLSASYLYFRHEKSIGGSTSVN